MLIGLTAPPLLVVADEVIEQCFAIGLKQWV
jgi:hypothetical protein